MEGKASSEAEDNRALIAESVTPPTVWVLLMIHCAYVHSPAGTRMSSGRHSPCCELPSVKRRHCKRCCGLGSPAVPMQCRAECCVWVLQSLAAADRTVRLGKRQIDAATEQWDKQRRSLEAEAARAAAQIKELEERLRAMAAQLGEAQGEAGFATKAAESARQECRREVRRLQLLVSNAEDRAEVWLHGGAGLAVRWNTADALCAGFCACWHAEAGGTTRHRERGPHVHQGRGRQTCRRAGNGDSYCHHVRHVVCSVRLLCSTPHRTAPCVLASRRLTEAAQARKDVAVAQAMLDDCRQDATRRVNKLQLEVGRLGTETEAAQRHVAELEVRVVEAV